MLLVVGTIRVAPEAVARMRPVMEELAAATRQEDGCIEYGCAEDLLDPGLIHVKDIWRDQAALDRHRETPHTARARESMGGLNVLGGELQIVDFEAFRPF
jgi:quinol monooxygenase YgiN